MNALKRGPEWVADWLYHDGGRELEDTQKTSGRFTNTYQWVLSDLYGGCVPFLPGHVQEQRGCLVPHEVGGQGTPHWGHGVLAKCGCKVKSLLAWQTGGPLRPPHGAGVQNG